MASRECIVGVFAFVGGAYGPKFPTPTATDMQVWEQLLEDLDDEVLTGAVVAHCQTETWPPTPAELIERCRHRIADRAHRPFELDEGERTERDPRIDELLRRTREQLAGRDDEDDAENVQDDAEDES